jgi:uncharacterized phage protein (TIGR01671 family)
MAREIKFRVWDTTLSHGFWHWSASDTDFNLAKELKNGTMPINQFTGLHDKNGKEIYEGDVIEWSVYEDAQDTPSGEEEQHHRRDSVYFSNGCFAFERRKELLFNFLAPHRKLEVIGNIYENPDLLK